LNLNKASVLKIAAGSAEDTAVLELNGPRVPGAAGQRGSARSLPRPGAAERGTWRAWENAASLIFKHLESVWFEKRPAGVRRGAELSCRGGTAECTGWVAHGTPC